MDLSEHYKLPFFEEHGFTRKACSSCGSHFWTLDAAKQLCGDPPCVEYSFIGSPITKKGFDLPGMRERFLGYLEAHDHERVRRQPVVARWREDIYLNIASISNYQPHVTGGRIPPPANPLAVSQPCIRLNDVDSVGRSGRHLTMFEMMAHHCFNYPQGHRFRGPDTTDSKTYFKNHTVELCHGFMDALGSDLTEVTYKENPWAGGGNAGPAFEVLTHGLEVATLVFMQWEKDAGGSIQVKGDPYSEMALKIVDTGYGLERFVWASQGTPTIYEAVFPKVVEALSEEADLSIRKDQQFAPILAEHAKLSCILDVDTGQKLHALREQVVDRLAERGIETTASELAEKLAPLEAMYAVADHTRCLTFMLGDGIVPSNVRAGYLARLLARKSLRLLQEVGVDMDLYDIVELHLDDLKDDYPELWRARGIMEDILGLETERFEDTLARGRRLVQRQVQEQGGQALSPERLVELYDSHGMPPEIVADVAEEAGAQVEVPDDFYARVADLHSTEEEDVEETEEAPDLPDTDLLFYDDPTARDFSATVLWVQECTEEEQTEHREGDAEPGDGSHKVILDQTCFYPEGGGQPADQGFLFVREETRRVSDVQMWDGLVVHYLDGPVKVGETVRGQLDWGRRQSLTKNHTATHLVGGAARSVLGPHVWQSGAQKGPERSRIDITHYQRITDEELREMETLANAIVLEGRPVEKLWMDRVEAEKKYGFILYQGGVPGGEAIRVVRIPEFDVQACGGTHGATTGELGLIKIFRTERVQDGVERIEFSAGLSALREIQAREDILQATANTFDVPFEELPKTSRRFFQEWKRYRKEADELRTELATQKLGTLSEEAEAVGDAHLVAARVDVELDDLVAAAGSLIETPGHVAVVGGLYEGKAGIVVARSPDLEVDAREIAQAAGRVLGGGGGGTPEMARSGGPNVEALDEAIQAGQEAARKALSG